MMKKEGWNDHEQLKKKIMCNDGAKKRARSRISVDNEVLEEAYEYQYLARVMKYRN